MNCTAGPPVPEMDARSIAGLRDVLAGGHIARRRDHDFAERIIARWPSAPALVQAANLFHARAAKWAVGGGAPDYRVPPAAGVLFGASGYPLHGGFHGDALLASPDAMVAYASSEEDAVAYARAMLAAADPAHVSAYQASARCPGGLLGAPEAQAILGRGPMMVQVQLCCQWWSPEFCAWVLAEYARILRSGPPGSTLALSVIVPGGGAGTAEFSQYVALAGGTLYAHPPARIAQWLRAAGCELTPHGITDVRGHELAWAADEFGRQKPVARTVEAVALVR